MSGNDDHDHTTETLVLDDVVLDDVVLDRPPRDTSVPPIRQAGRLVCVVGDDIGRVYPLGDRPTTIGRGSEADVQVEGPDVSRKHARIVWESDHYVIEDLGSRNGTSINGLPVRRNPLRIGDRIQIGASAILVFAHHDELEQRALRLQKLESLAQLAGGMVHDFRNMISVIMANTDLLHDELGAAAVGGADAHRSLHDIRAAAAAGLELTDRLLHFARRNEATGWTPIAIAELIDDVLGMVRRSLGIRHGIEVETRLDSTWQIRGNRGELHQALLNLCLNARDAMPRGGTLSIQGQLRTLGRTDALRLHLPISGTYLELSVTDTGLGMDGATLARVFEPFFTTKAPAQGTGLGLSTAFGVVRNHGGNLFVQSAPGQGATFQILLPAHDADGVPEVQP